MSTEIQRKSFFEKPEGKTGAFVLVAAAVAVAWLGWHLLPIIITLLANTLIAGALAAALVVLFFIVTNKNFQFVVSHLFKRSMFLMTDAVIAIDPIGVLRVRVATMWENVKKMESVQTTLSQQIRLTRDLIRRNDAERAQAIRGAETTKSQFDYYLNTRQSGRLEQSTMSAREWLDKLEAMSGLIDRYVQLTTVFAKDTEAEAKVQEAKRKMILANYNVYKAAKKAMAGQDDKLEEFNRSLEWLTNDAEAKFAEIETFVDHIDSVVSGMDMEAGVFDQDAVTNFEVWEKKANLLLLGPGEQNRFAEAMNVTNTQPESVPVGGTAPRKSYADLFGEKK